MRTKIVGDGWKSNLEPRRLGRGTGELLFSKVTTKGPKVVVPPPRLLQARGEAAMLVYLDSSAIVKKSYSFDPL